jgi:hypothetical protein
MHYLVKMLLVLAMPILSGCTFFNVLFFSADENSFQLKGSKATIEVFHDSGGACPSTEKEFIAAAPVFAALAQVAVNVAASEIDAYLAKKQKEFNASYKATVNLPGLYELELHRASAGQPFNVKKITNHARCIMIKRTFEEGVSAEPISEEEAKKHKLAFWWAGQLLDVESGSASKFRTDKIMLRRAAAKTDSSTRKVDVTVELKIDAITTNDKGEAASTATADKILTFPGLTTPERKKDAQPLAFPTAETGKGSNSSGESSWFPRVPYSQKDIDRCVGKAGAADLNTKCLVVPVTISFLVTEAGSGSSDFGDLAKEIDDNKKTLGDALNKALADGINKKASSGK